MSKRNTRDIILVSAVIGVIGFGLGGSYFKDRERNTRIKAVLNGEIRGNKASMVFHVPTCPEYDSISERNLRTFETVGDAEAANYRPSRNCLEAVSIREINETEVYEGPDGGHDDPRY